MGIGASVPVVPNRDTGEMEEAHYVKEVLGRPTMGRLCREVVKRDSQLRRVSVR